MYLIKCCKWCLSYMQACCFACNFNCDCIQVYSGIKCSIRLYKLSQSLHLVFVSLHIIHYWSILVKVRLPNYFDIWCSGQNVLFFWRLDYDHTSFVYVLNASLSVSRWVCLVIYNVKRCFICCVGMGIHIKLGKYWQLHSKHMTNVALIINQGMLITEYVQRVN